MVLSEWGTLYADTQQQQHDNLQDGDKPLQRAAGTHLHPERAAAAPPAFGPKQVLHKSINLRYNLAFVAIIHARDCACMHKFSRSTQVVWLQSLHQQSMLLSTSPSFVIPAVCPQPQRL